MRKLLIYIVLAVLFSFYSYSQDHNKIKATLFYSPHCKVCLKLKEELLPSLKEKYKEEVVWDELNTYESKDNLGMLMSLAERFEKEEALVPAVFVGDIFLVGVKEIQQYSEAAIKESLKNKVASSKMQVADVVDFFKKISIFTIITAGLIDGVNPCAFAVMVFFISFLGVYGYRKKEVICVGVFYCVAVFITYLMIGLGFFKFLYSVEKIYTFIKAFYYLVSFFCFLMSALALFDYVRFRRTKTSDGTILQLPKFFKKHINIVIGSRMREKTHDGMFSLAVTSFAVGFLVSLLEAVCTGQMYIPAIVFILKNTDLRLKASAYLVLYNLMFILPLVFIFLLSLAGVSSARFNNFLKRNVGRIKIALAIIFLILGIFILTLS